jgi:K+-sensing histidine kinase KdpD
VVELAAVVSDDAVMPTVGNDGPPISGDVRGGLFERYGHRNASQGATNRGLGLYLCRLVADRHGGSISVRHREGGGVCFDLSLPRRGLASTTRSEGKRP